MVVLFQGRNGIVVESGISDIETFVAVEVSVGEIKALLERSYPFVPQGVDVQGAYRRFRKRAGVVFPVLNIGDLQLFGVENGDAFQFGPYPYLVTDDFQASYNVVRQSLVAVCIGVGVEADEAVRHGIVYVQSLDGAYQDAVIRGDSKFGYLIAREAAPPPWLENTGIPLWCP